MKINFNRKHSVSLEFGSVQDFRWLNEYIKGFLEHHDLKHDGDSDNFLKGPRGVRVLADWIAAQGLQVSYWELDYRTGEDQPPLAYGLDFRDDCPKFIEAKLRYS